ncbi:hypothetical protein QYE76_036987 [Lolium multiflorum]|uniref:Reverse transcriptase domain-containing protein n=1 Tax=Lolium multiflorum TaxID=4521 RepID=A0AAD8R4L7_LOLMU|nr:hypothetical protein QYE76_036987 [Lolium multiflorum]
MLAFIGGLQRGGLLRHKLTCIINEQKLTLDDMISIASTHSAVDDNAGGELHATTIPLHQQKKNRDGNSNNKRKNPSEEQKGSGSYMVAMTFQRGGQGGGRGRGRGGGAGRGQQRADEVTAIGFRAPQTYEEYRDMPCLAHIDPATGKSSHTNRNGKWVNDLKSDPEAGYKLARKHRPRGIGGKGKNKEKDEDSSVAMEEGEASPNPKEDHPTVIPKECYALVVSPRIAGYDFSKCLMDGGASLNIMYLETLERMNLTKEQLKHRTTEFHGVVLDYKKPRDCEEGKATFVESVLSGEELQGYRAVVDPSDMHTSKKQISDQKNSFKAAIDTKKVDLKEGDATKQVSVGAGLDPKLESALVEFLGANMDIFAWQPSDMSGVPRELAEHYLNINPGAKPVKQAMRHFGDKKRRAIGMELVKLLEAGFVVEVIHTDWVANPVLVPKKNSEILRRFIDYSGLNKQCPKDPLPLPRIDQIIDSTAGVELMCFINTSSGYHQIRMKKSDQKATLFITPFGTYCYVTMPFGLKNAGATYQRMM